MITNDSLLLLLRKADTIFETITHFVNQSESEKGNLFGNCAQIVFAQ